jgi:hypothetical protein
MTLKEKRDLHTRTKGTISELHDRFYTKKKQPAKADNKAIAEKLKITSTGPSRNDLMLQAKAKGIKNFRILNKEELTLVLNPTSNPPEAEINAIITKAVERWKSGWGKHKQEAK